MQARARHSIYVIPGLRVAQNPESIVVACQM